MAEGCRYDGNEKANLAFAAYSESVLEGAQRRRKIASMGQYEAGVPVRQPDVVGTIDLIRDAACLAGSPIRGIEVPNIGPRSGEHPEPEHGSCRGSRHSLMP